MIPDDLKTRILIAIRGRLVRAARDNDVPEGFAPSFRVYRDWARERDEKTPDNLERAAGRVFDVRATRKNKVGEYRMNWGPMVKAVGLRPISEAPTVDPALCRESVIRVARVLADAGDLERGAMPTRAQYDECEARLVDSSTLYKHLAPSSDDNPRGGYWNDIARDCGLEPTRAKYGARTREEVVEDFRRLSIEAGYEPGGYGLNSRHFEDAAGYYLSRRWGRVAEIIRDAGFVPRPPPEEFAGTDAA